MKKTNRKLIPAVAMLLISAIMLSTSSFAWFSMNSKVTATGMEVKATASKNLLIAGEKDGYAKWGVTTSEVWVNTHPLMMPATSTSGTQFFYPKTEKASKYDTSTLNDADNAEFVKASARGEYFYQTTLKVKSESASESFAKLTVDSIDVKYGGSSIIANAAGHQLGRSIRVAITVGGTTQVYAPVESASSAYKSIPDGDPAGVRLQGSVVPVTTGTDADFMQKIANEPVPVVVSIWFEGQDAACTSALAAIDTNAFAVELGFSASGDGV